MFVESEKNRSAGALGQARALKMFLLTFVGLIILAFAVGAIYLFFTRPPAGSLPR